MNRLMIILCMALAMLTSAAWAAPEFEESRGTGLEDREFRSWVGMGGQPGSSEAKFRSFGGTSAYSCANFAAGGDRKVRYVFTLPQGEFLEWVRVWGRKVDGTADVTLRLRRSCMSQSQTVPSTVTLSSTQIEGNVGEFSETLPVNVTIDNLDCKYWMDVEFGPNSQACSASTGDLAIYKIRTQNPLPDLIFWDRFIVSGSN
jgi:hypothetical protein